MLYLILRWLFRFAVKGYFRSIYIKGQEKIPTSGPIIFVANHTSAFMDPILLGTQIKQSLHFLARGEAFKSKWAAGIFKFLNMIPVYRPEVEPEKVHLNTLVFQKCHDHLSLGKSILIFPEGFSKTERRLRHFKTGAARIALGAEEQNNFNLGVKIVPIGINYSNPHHFRSDVFVNYGDPIEIKSYEDQYIKDQRATAVALTNEIKKRIEERVVIVKDEQLDIVIKQIEIMYRSKLRADPNPKEKAPQDFYLSKNIVRAVELYQKEYPDKMHDFERKINLYLKTLKQLHIRDTQVRNSEISLKLIERIFYFVLGFPFFLYGYIVNYIPFKTAELLAKWIRVRKDFIGSMKLALGMFLFLIIYLIQFFIIGTLSSLIIAAIALFTWYPAGIFTINYIKNFYLFRGSLNYLRLFMRKSDLIVHLKTTREELVDQLEEGKKLYLGSIA